MALRLRRERIEVFDDWYAPGPEADDFWRKYSLSRGQTYQDALKSYAGTHIFEFDKFHLDRASGGVLVLPAGKSGHLELGYLIGQGKTGYILFDKEPEPERWDVMYQFASGGIYYDLESLVTRLVTDGMADKTSRNALVSPS